jgi:uncharacterized protein YjiK
MQPNKLFSLDTTIQLAILLGLVLTFSFGLITGRHISNENQFNPDVLSENISGPHFPYELGQPTRTLALPAILREVSALSYVDEQRIAMVQDENGIIFFSSLRDGQILNKVTFAKSGDYEGIVILKDEAWVLRSDGDLYHVSEINTNKPSITKIETMLKHKDDTEGLTYDAQENQLLIGLKEPPELDGKRRNDKRAIYTYDLERNFMSASPYMTLDMSELKRVYENQVPGKKSNKFDPEKKQEFQPSDLAIHPITGHIYHIAAKGQLLVVSDRRGIIRFVRNLPDKIFKQPEGISFDPRGHMFIASEGSGSNGTLLEFRYQPVAAEAKSTLSR